MINCLSSSVDQNPVLNVESHIHETKLQKSKSFEQKIEQICLKTQKLRNKYAKSHATNQSIGKNKQISLKMRKKLLTWLEKLAIQTFEFSQNTYFLGAQIIDQYLALTNQPPKQLQIIGCAALLMASKQSEGTVVASQCYITACKELFTVKELQDKQMTIFQTLNHNISFFILPRLLSAYCTFLSIETSVRRHIVRLLRTILKHEIYVLITEKLFFEVLLAEVTNKGIQFGVVEENQIIEKLQNKLHNYQEMNSQ